jgi:tyrosine-protein phosphatase SIW14
MMQLPRRRLVTRRVWLGAGLTLAALVAVAVVAPVRASLAARDEKRVLPGVENFGRVDAHLYRGAQPAIAAYPALKALGIDTIVRLSTGGVFIEGERRRVEALGMRFVSLPWRAADDPTTAQVAAFLTVIRRDPGAHVFVHCREGADRTGVMVAVYRIAVDHWTPARAIAEMKAFHYYWVFHPHLERYVATFPARLASDPALRGFAPAIPPR